MGLPRFSIIKNKSGKDCRIRYDITVSKRYRSRGLTDSWVDFDQWDSKKREAKERAPWKEKSMRINSELIAFKEHCKTLVRIKDGVEYDQEIDLYFGRLTKDDSDHVNIDLLSYIEREIENKKVSSKRSTIYGYNSLLRSLKAYRDINKKIVSFDQIQSTFYSNYIKFMLDPHEYEVYGKMYTIGGVSVGTISKYLGMLRMFMRESREAQIHNNIFCDSSAFKKMSNDTYEVYLTEDELELLWNYSSDDPFVQACVDYFLISSETCLRMVDLLRVSSNDINTIDGDQVLEFFEEKKTGANEKPKYKSFILNDRVVGILAKYGNRFPNEVLDRKTYHRMINNKIKDVCKEVGISTIENGKPKYEMVVATTARRSFCTNAFLKGIPIPEIRKQSFHENDATTMKYIKEASPKVSKFIDTMRKKGKLPNYISYK